MRINDPTPGKLYKIKFRWGLPTKSSAAWYFHKKICLYISDSIDNFFNCHKVLIDTQIFDLENDKYIFDDELE